LNNTRVDKLQFLIDWYNREEERKSSVENSLNIPIGILTFLFAMQFYLIKEFDFGSCQIREKYWLLGSVSASFIASLIAGLYIFKSYRGIPKEYRYGGIPYPSQLLSYEKDLISFYKENSAQFQNVTGEEKFNEYLQNKLAEHIDKNTFNNDEKYRFLNISKTLMFAGVVTLLIAFIPFLVNLFTRPYKPQQIEIVNPVPFKEQVQIIESDKLKQQIHEQRKASTTDSTTTTSGQADKRN
jgi:hypothetical protein